MTSNLRKFCSLIWTWVRAVSGDDAYDRYLQHWRHAHFGEPAPLNRRQFQRERQAERWNGIKRCC